MSFWKFLLYAVGGLIAIAIALRVLSFAVHVIFNVLVPVAVVLGIGYVVYRIATRDKALPGNRRPLP